MNKFCTNFICSLIPNKKKRKKVKEILLGKTPKEYNIKKHLQKIKDSILFDIKDFISFNTYQTKINNIALKMHSEIFPKYRGIYNDRDIVIVGCGPTVEDYHLDIKDNPVYICINRAFKISKIKFDYIFFQDQFNEGFDEIETYQGNNCKKFQAIITKPSCEYVIAQDVTNKINSIRYILSPTINGKFPYDIAFEPFADFSGTVFSAMQFALYTNPRRIYLVGFDRSDINYFTKGIFNYNYQIDLWKRMKEYSDYHYPSTEIISVNPVGLRGLFKDIYTQSFLDKNNK